MTLRDLQAAYLAGEVVVTCDEAEPWKIAKVSRSSWYRFMASDEAPAGLCLKLGRRRLLSLPVFLAWIGAKPDQAPPGGECATAES